MPCSVYCISDSESDRRMEQKLGNVKSSNEEVLIYIIRSASRECQENLISCHVSKETGFLYIL